MKKRAPIWFKFFAVSVLLIFVVVLFMTVYFIFQMVGKENYILEVNIADNLYYADLNVSQVLNRYREQVGSVSVSESIYKAKRNTDGYRAAVRERLSSFYNESTEIIAVFFQDTEGACFSAGEVFWDVDSQLRLIHECKSNPEYNRGDGLWRYEVAGRGFHSLVLCRDIIFVDEQYRQTELGTMLLYLDADKVGKNFFRDDKNTGILILDPFGVIALAQDEELIGLEYNDVFEVGADGALLKDNRKYIAYEKETDINGWNAISYIDVNLTGKSLFDMLFNIILIALGGLAAVSWVSYAMSKRVGRPIEELLSYIKVNKFGKTAEIPGEDNDIARVKGIFESMSSELRKNIESNYEMQLKLKDITIKAYESQMNPHFLFNTLQMIQMMNILGRTEDVTRATNSLGQLLRFNLDNRNEVRFSEEIENVVNYLKILELRFKGRFNYKIMIPNEIMDCYTVKFMLQPLIENTVTHGFAHKKGMCEVAVMAQVIDGEIAVIVKDNGRGITPDKLKEIKSSLYGVKNSVRNGGIGLVNVHERIQLIYGKEYGVDIFSDYMKSTQVLIHIPMCAAPQDKEEEYVQISDY